MLFGNMHCNRDTGNIQNEIQDLNPLQAIDYYNFEKLEEPTLV